MKKTAIILALVMVVMCVGCGGKKAAETTKAETTKPETTKAETTEAPIEFTVEIPSDIVVEETTEVPTEVPTEAPTEAPTTGDVKLDFLNKITDTDQVIMVIGDGETTSGGTMYFYQKNGDTWECKKACQAYVGQNGFSNSTEEGDRTTPTGIFGVGVSFGNKSNPGPALDWFDVEDKHVWVDDPNSEYYNKLIDKYETPEGWNSGEHLIDYQGPYAYSFNIEVNPPYHTSAIFFHCFGPNNYTGGCVSVSEEDCVWVLQNINKNAKVVIAQNESDLASMN